ncbi:MAG: GTPase HflX [Opitutales bacterium]|nr:GTPase HflX [Opitutales bacterium]MCH8541258.1 GTPase HflX [Opitutales bacterium]
MFEVKEKPKMVERAFLVGIQTPEMNAREGEELLAELAELVRSLEIGVVGSLLVNLREPKARFLVGGGKTEEILAAVKEHKADAIVFDEELTPAQQRNWEKESSLCVIDRQEVIIDIFGQRAQTKEATLQVELARMEYSLPRLKRAWTHLSRQRGGGGTVVRGQGETQLEADRRLVQTRIAKLKRELAEVRQHREIQRKQRLRRPVPTAALVGYTNAGKSSLLNSLTGAGVLVEDKLFATLDPTTRQCHLPDGQKVLLTDTVGFVRRLPHKLVDAFRATLEEALLADVLIHVVDLSSPDAEEHRQTTLSVLEELGADESKLVTVYNKIDAVGNLDEMERFRFLHREALFVSAHTKEGLPQLGEKIGQIIAGESLSVAVLIPYDKYDLVGKLHDLDAVTEQRNEDDGVYLECLIPPKFEPLVHDYLIEPVAGQR